MIAAPSSRREVMTLLGGAWLATTAAAQRPMNGDTGLDLFAGGYDREGGQGVLPLRYTPESGQWQTGRPVASAPDASFGIASSRHRLQYLVQEQRNGNVMVFRAAGDDWRRLASVPSLGDDPCHLALDGSQSALAVANYSSGSITLFRLDPATGLPIAPGTRRVHQGHGPNRERQGSAHAHWVGFTPDNRWLLAVDLGADAIMAYPFDAARGELGEARIAYRGAPGAGPRHLALHPSRPYAYLVNELANTVTVLRTGPGPSFAAVASLSTLPPGFTGANTAAEIALNEAGTRLYVSNRGHDSLAMFAVQPDGGLAVRQHVSSGGQGPRYFRMLEARKRLLVANERSGRIVPFRIEADGRLTPEGASVAAPGVTYIGREA